MKKSITLLFFFFVNFLFFSQQFNVGKNQINIQGSNAHKCGFDGRNKDLLENDANYVQKRQAEEEHYQNFLNLPYVEKAIKTIPVVVHVIHLGEAPGTGTNISDAQIISAIDNLNDAYSNIGYTGVDTEIQFCLAQRDESGNPTSGIVRVDGTGVADYSTQGIISSNEVAVKALSKWDNTEYYNFWIVSEIDDNGGGGGTQGYAYFPGASSARDGAVILYNAFGYDPGVGNSAGFNLKDFTDRNVTTIHEIGHALNLYHTFEGDIDGNTCPTGNQCGSDLGDCIADTPPHKRSTSNCAINTIDATCNNVDRDLYVHNFMDYSSDVCQTEFTAGQSTRMNAVLSFGGGRYSLTQSSGCVPADNALDASITAIVAPISSYCQTTFEPQVTLRNFGTSTLTSVDILYNIDGGANDTYNWTGSLATGASITVTLDEITTTQGAHTFNVITDAPNGGTDEYTANDDLSIAFTITGSSSLPFTEDFEGAFPPADWTNYSADIAPVVAWDVESIKAFEKRDVTQSDGTAGNAVGLNAYAYNPNSGGVDELTTPAINLGSAAVPTLRFQVSHKVYGGSGNQEVLRVLVSTNCGVSFTEVYNKSYTDLSTNAGPSGNVSWSPTASGHWRLESIDLSAYAGQVVTIKFEGTSGYGNNFYFDKINVFDNCTAPTVLSSTPASRCGTGDLTISALPSAGTIRWYDQAVGGTLLFTGNSYLINGLSSSTNYYAEAVSGSCVSAVRTLVTASIYNCTKLIPQDCGATLEELNEILYYSPVVSATNYEYWVEGPNGYSQTKLRGSNKVTMDMSWFPNLLMEATYSVKIRAFVGGVWQDYGDACNITTPKTKLRIGSCGLELTTWNKILYYSAVYNATDYEYLVEGPNGYSQTKTRGSNKTTMDISWFTGMLTNATYTVKIRARVGGIWGDYGDACTIKTPATTNLISGSCGRVLTALNKPLYYTGVFGATNYEYLVEGPNGYSQTHIRGNNKLTMDMTWLHNIQPLAPSTVYTVQIRALVGGIWQAYGSACNITTPASLGLIVQNSGTEVDKFETIKLNAYPNPSNGDFTISSSHEGTFNIINELGQLVQTVEITKENNYQVHIDVNSMHALNQQLQPGIYFITGTINNEVITRKIIVQ